jgi:hypothetical protein
MDITLDRSVRIDGVRDGKAVSLEIAADLTSKVNGTPETRCYISTTPRNGHAIVDQASFDRICKFLEEVAASFQQPGANEQTRVHMNEKRGALAEHDLGAILFMPTFELCDRELVRF